MVETRESMKSALSVGHSYTFDRSATVVLFRCLGLVILGILLGLLHSFSTAAQTPAKNVLVMSSFGYGHASIDLMESSLRTRVPWPVNFSLAYLENPHFEEDSYQESLVEILRRGYARQKLSLVVTVSEPALRFAVRYRDKIFPGVPIVFMSISTLLADQKMPGVTGVATAAGARATIDLALHLHPDTTAIAVIAGESQIEKDWLAAAHAELLGHEDKVREIDLIGSPGSQMIERVAALPPHTVALFQMIPQDSNQPAIGVYNVLAAATQHLPTYSVFERLALDRGGIGGAYYDPAKEPLLAGEIAARVLSGEQVDNIPVVHDPYLQIRMDWRQLQRWHIPESAVPPGSIVLYRKPTLWQSYRKYVLAAIVLIVAQALLIIGLLWQRARKRKAEAVLLESEERFRVMANTTPSLVWMCDQHGKITYLNERRLAFTDPDLKAGYGDSWVTYVHPDDVKNMMESLSHALKTRRPFSQEYRLRNRDGVYRWMFDVASPRVNGDGSFAGFIGSVIDTTDQKLAQQAIEKMSGQLIEAQRQERSRIARELHDDIGQRLALLAVELDQLHLEPPESPELLDRMGELQKQASEIATDIQALSRELHSTRRDNLSPFVAMGCLCHDMGEQLKVKIDFQSHDLPGSVPPDVSLCLFRVLQEALRNSVKHSGAQQVDVGLWGTSDEIHLSVSDRGVGFDIQAAKVGRGLGLVSMEERLKLVKGNLSINSQPKGGTTIHARVPLHSTSDSVRAAG